MNAAMPAILQQSLTTSAPRSRHDTSSSGDGNEFSDLVKSDGKAKSATSSSRKDENRVGQSEPSSDLDLLKDELANTTQETVSPDSAEAEGGRKESEASDETQAAEALLPFLTVPQQRSPVPTGENKTENTAGPKGADAAAAVAKAARAAQGAGNEEGNARTVAILEKSDAATSSGRAETTFGKTLIANLNDIATQASGQAEARPDEDGFDLEVADPLADRRGVRRDRGTLTADAVARTRQAQDIGERQAEMRPAELRSQPVQLTQAPLSNGAPVVQAVAGHTASAANRAAMVNAEGQPAASPTQALKIQLKPVELGTVTAHLRITGEQLSVEIEVESAEAYKRLSSETEAIARALRSHGIAVEEVVIQAPQVQAAASVRDGPAGFADNSSNAGRNFSTGAESGQSGGSGHPNSDAGRDNGHETDRLSSSEKRTVSGSDRGGVYI